MVIAKDIGRGVKINLRLALFIFSFIPSVLVLAQNKQASIWHVGNKRLDFNINPVTVTDVAAPFQGTGNSTALSDIDGNFLLFASSTTKTIYNNTFVPVKNGTEIEIPNGRRLTLFIPKPENDSLVYLITLNKYSVIDTKNDTVIEKNIQWTDLSFNSPNILASYHSNCKDVWLIFRNEEGLYSYLVTENGILSDYLYFSTQDRPQFSGTISPSGKYYFMPRRTSTNLTLVDFGVFNKNTGAFENTLLYEFGDGLVMTNCFSPDETKLYLFWQVGATRTYYTYQIDIINGVPDFANAIIVNTQNYTSIAAFSDMQIGLDEKIYQSYYFAAKKINIIHNPNTSGLACNYQDNAIPLTTYGNTVPNFISNWLTDTPCELDFYSEKFCIPESTYFYINNITNIQSVLWNFGDGQTSTELEPTHTYAAAGTYTVTLEVTFTDSSTQTITKDIEFFDKPLKPIIEHE